METPGETILKCVKLKGDLEDWGKHILMPSGATLCGMPTVACDTEQIPQLKNKIFEDMLFEYTVEEWDITCERCLDMIDILEKNRENIN